MSKVKATTVVRHPDTGIATPLLEGAEIPRWAESLVGDHLVESEPKPPVKRGGSRS